MPWITEALYNISNKKTDKLALPKTINCFMTNAYIIHSSR
ncbi:hypothetical protein H206_05323 [Candidatus Electrothrix aarhusensis]|uniref:Uncharacterized protein n=1 Tax=Candidatus Electrothrix aarhusensis TaxID=1859131 RepID=A0A444J4S0_9BACT|nr:hypothetical protein H206_05323 [Candidatus Electrothrix aarhusensis]